VTTFTDLTDLVVALGERVIAYEEGGAAVTPAFVDLVLDLDLRLRGLEAQLGEVRARLQLGANTALRPCRVDEAGHTGRRSPMGAALLDAVAAADDAFELVDLLGYPPDTWKREGQRRGLLWRTAVDDGVRRYWRPK
jgi:hypothetical protein